MHTNNWRGFISLLCTIFIIPVLAWADGSTEQYMVYNMPINLSAIALEDSVSITSKNPFDKSQIQLRSSFISPIGDTMIVNGYYSKKLTLLRDSSKHHKFWPFLPHEYIVDQNTDNGTWNIRFVPEVAGMWHYSVDFVLPAENRSVPVIAGQLNCENGNPRNGFARLSNRQYFTYPNDEAFKPLGINLAVYPEWCAYSPKSSFYDLYFKRLNENGGNFARIWIDFYECLQLFNATANTGRISMPDAEYLETIISLAEHYGIKLQVCIFAANNFENPTNESGLTIWNARNTFSTRLGGPCLEPRDFFDTANATAMDLQKNFIAYVIDRWGSSPSVLSWELINEAEGVTSDSVRMVSWHREMYNYIKEYDPYKHAVTTSFMGGADRCYGFYNTIFDKMDYASLHRYVDQWGYPTQNSKDIWYNCSVSYRTVLPDVPVCMGETGSFASDHMYRDYEQLDTFALNYHSELWSSLFFGGIMPVSYWDWYIFIQRGNNELPASNYLRQLPAVREFMQEMPPLGAKDYEAHRILPHKRSQLRAYYMQNRNERAIWGWVQDERLQINNLIGPEKHMGNAYLRALDSVQRPQRIGEKNIMKFKKMPASGKYRIQWYSTETGKLVAEETRHALFRHIDLSIPDVLFNGKYGDAAFSIIYLRNDVEL